MNNICRIGNELETEFYGNGSFLKYCRYNNEAADFIYLKKIIIYSIRDSYIKAIELVFFNDKLKEYMHTDPKIFGIHNTFDNKILDEQEFILNKGEVITKIEGIIN